jgi:hypothetical protein
MFLKEASSRFRAGASSTIGAGAVLEEPDLFAKQALNQNRIVHGYHFHVLLHAS